MRQRQLPFNKAAERGTTVSPSMDAALLENLCPADGVAGRPGREYLFFINRKEIIIIDSICIRNLLNY